MNLLESDQSKGLYKLRIEDMDDLWYLYQLIRPGCNLGSHTYRKLEAREDTIRPDNQPRVKVYLEIGVTNTEFHPFTDNLRVGGTIITGPDDMSGHHTFNLEPGKNIDLIIPSISTEEKELLMESLDPAGRSRALAISLDDESAQIFRIRNYGVEQIASIRMKEGGKQFNVGGGWESYYTEISDALNHYLGEGIPVIIVGPGFFKESLAKMLRQESGIDPSSMYILNASTGGLRGLNEAMSKGKGMTGAVQDLRYQKETSMVNSLMEAIGKGHGAAYGIEEVNRALDMGAVDLLLISESIFRKDIGRNMLEKSSQTGSRGMIISTSHEAGQMLEKLGGAGAILRFDPQ